MRPDRRSGPLGAESLRRRAQLESLEQRLTFAADVAPTEIVEASVAPALIPLGTVDFELDETLHAGQTFESQSLDTLATSAAHALTGVDYVQQQYGLDGAGQTVAIIDSGIAWDHPALGGGLGSEYRVVGGWDFAEGDANPYDDGPSGFHGTHVAGIVGSSDPTALGVAPGVDIVSLRVFNDNGSGQFEWVEQALQWVHVHRNDYANPITTVNLSLGARWNSDSIPEWATLEDEFAQLKADGIFVAVAAGNSFTQFQQAGLSYPAASPYVVPVMSVKDSTHLSSFSQRSTRALAAPGEGILSTIPDHASSHPDGVANDFGNASGTSMASPYLAGAAALVREALTISGATGIDQDDIYNLLWTTADVFYDGTTAANYRLIDVRAAVEAALGADDYGSTAATAKSLGTVAAGGAGTQISGGIQRTDDRDFFTFIAGATGRITVSAAPTAGLSPTWQTPAGATVSTDSLQFQLDVVAGQTYTFAVGGRGGLGHYQLSLKLTAQGTSTGGGSTGGGGATGGGSTGAVVDAGTIDLWRLDQQVVAGQRSYSLTASRTATLTVAASYRVGGGAVRLEVYRTGALVASSRTGSGAERVDLAAAAGDTFEVRLIGTNAAVDLVAANLVAVDGTTADIFGTSRADTFQFTAGAGSHRVTVDGIDYTLTASTIVLRGGAGNDSVTLQGRGGERGAARQGAAWLTGSGYTVQANHFEQVTLDSPHGALVRLYDSAGDDHLVSDSTSVTLSGVGFQLVARGFQTREAYASDGNDSAELRGTAGDDVLVSAAGRVELQSLTARTAALGFDLTRATAGSGGNDVALMYDTVGDDQFRLAEGQAEMTSGSGQVVAIGFDRSYALSTRGGQDQVTIEDTAGDDRFTLQAEIAYATLGGAYVHARGFERVLAQSTHGGHDLVTLYDSAGDDRFTALPDYVQLRGDGFYNSAAGFAEVYAYSSGGHDTAQFYDGSGNDQFVADRFAAVMSGAGYLVSARRFESVTATSTAGGADTATLTGAGGADHLVSTASETRLSGDGYLLAARGFGMVHAIGGQNDTAVLYTSPSEQRQTSEDETRVVGSSTRIATGFASVQSIGGLAASSTAPATAPSVAPQSETDDQQSADQVGGGATSWQLDTLLPIVDSAGQALPDQRAAREQLFSQLDLRSEQASSLSDDAVGDSSEAPPSAHASVFSETDDFDVI